jgi:hypothetical protein
MKNCIIKQEGTAVSSGTVGVIIQQKILRLHPDIINLYQVILIRTSCQHQLDTSDITGAEFSGLSQLCISD